MKQFASKLAPYLKPFIKKLTTTYIKKQLTTEDNMKESKNNRHSLLTQQLQVISDDEHLTAQRKVLLENQEIKHKKNLRQAQLKESPLKGVIVGSFQEPLFLPFLQKINPQLLHSNLNKTCAKKLFENHVDVLMTKGYDKTTGIKASNLRPDTQNQENQPDIGKTR